MLSMDHTSCTAHQQLQCMEEQKLLVEQPFDQWSWPGSQCQPPSEVQQWPSELDRLRKSGQKDIKDTSQHPLFAKAVADSSVNGQQLLLELRNTHSQAVFSNGSAPDFVLVPNRYAVSAAAVVSAIELCLEIDDNHIFRICRFNELIISSPVSRGVTKRTLF